MNEFSRQLKTIRLQAGFQSAKAFYENLKHGRKLTFNYSYYARIEKGETLPSSQVVTTLASLVSEPDSEALVRAYCRTLFPKHTHLFSSGDLPQLPEEKATQRESGPLLLKQAELTIEQVSILAQDRDTYHLFLATTLARKPIEYEHLKVHFSLSALTKAIRSLEKAELLISERGTVRASSAEAKFPAPNDERVKAAYRQLDEWDQEFAAKFNLAPEVHKLLIRRVSFRYISLIKSQLSLLFDLIKCSDESELKHNETVLHLSVSLSSGKIPG